MSPLAHIMYLSKQVSQKNVLGAALTDLVSDTLSILIRHIDMFHINACCRIQTVFWDPCFDSSYLWI